MKIKNLITPASLIYFAALASADTISDTTIYTNAGTVYGSDNTTWAYDSGSGKVAIQSSDIIDFSSCDLVFDMSSNFAPSTDGSNLEVKNLTVISGANMFLLNQSGSGNLSVINNMTIDANGGMTISSGSAGFSWGLSVGNDMIINGAGDKTIGTGFGNAGLSYVHIGNDLKIDSANLLYNVLSTDKSNPGFTVGGVIELTNNARLRAGSSNQASNANTYISAAGLNGIGSFMYDNYNSESGHLTLLLNGTDANAVNDFSGFVGFHFGPNASTINFEMNGAGTQIVRNSVAGDAGVSQNWIGKITANSGVFMLYSDKGTIDVEINNGKFGVLGESTDIGAVSVNNFTVNAGSGGLLVNTNADASSFSVMSIGGIASVEDSLTFFLEGINASLITEDTELLNFISWDSGDGNEAIFQALINENKLLVEIDGNYYDATFLAGDTGLSMSNLVVVPEPATVAAIFGAFALAAAAYRKRK